MSADTAQSIARISVVGVSGAGKSTVARMAAARLRVACIELDAIHHGPNWTEIPISELRRIVTELVAGETWVIDGNYRKVRDLIWGRATTVVWVDYAFANEDWVRERTGRCNLARIVNHALAREWDGPLALPKAVADVYLSDPDTLPIHRCEKCGYRIPTYIGPGAEQREVYFVECPLCGVRIRWELMRMSDSPVGPDGYPLHPKL